MHSGRQETFTVGERSITLSRPNHAEMVEVVTTIKELGEAAATQLLLEAAVNPDTLIPLLDADDHETVTALWELFYEFVGAGPFIKRLSAADQKAEREMWALYQAEGIVQGTYTEYMQNRLGLTSSGSTSETPA